MHDVQISLYNLGNVKSTLLEDFKFEFRLFQKNRKSQNCHCFCFCEFDTLVETWFKWVYFTLVASHQWTVVEYFHT